MNGLVKFIAIKWTVIIVVTKVARKIGERMAD